MDARKRKRLLATPLFFTQYFSMRFLTVCFCLFLFFHFLSQGFGFRSGPFRPAPMVPKLSVFSSSISKSIQDLTAHNRGSSSNSGGWLMGLTIQSRVLFNDHVLVILSANRKPPRQQQHVGERIDCVYHKGLNLEDETVVYPVLSVDEYGEGRWIVRCPIPPGNYSSVVGLRGHRKVDVAGSDWVVGVRENQTVQTWDNMVAYEAALDGKDTAAVFVKGLHLRSDRESDPDPFTCRFRKEGDDEGYALTTKAITAAQEIIRCPLHPDLKANLRNNKEVQITVEMTINVPGRSRSRGTRKQLVPSIAELNRNNIDNDKNNMGKNTYKYDLCACTMVWNQAAFMKEWIIYHAWLGVQRWFVYDNNSEDGLKEVIDELNSENYNVTRHAWPWVKSQEAGFSHCTLRVRDQCKWVAFFDVDEFYYFPPRKHRGDSNIIQSGPGSLRAVVQNVSIASPKVGEIRTDCRSFGPSGLKKRPAEGVTLGYTCRLKRTERHKSIVRPDVVDDTLLNQVHHFKLKKGFRRMNYRRAVINHYKYQVWDVFKAKFYRRVSTYVADWQENQNENSRDRAPGLGTEAIEPPNWHRRFCEVWDTRLRDFVMANLADPSTGSLPWERSVQ